MFYMESVDLKDIWLIMYWVAFCVPKVISIRYTSRKCNIYIPPSILLATHHLAIWQLHLLHSKSRELLGILNEVGVDVTPLISDLATNKETQVTSNKRKLNLRESLKSFVTR